MLWSIGAPEVLGAFLLLGAVVGFSAGLLGIGGGGLMVPVLTSLFLWQGMATDQVVHLALGTSMASIVITSGASLRAHHLRGGVIWSIIRNMAPGTMLGAFAVTFLVAELDSLFLALFFSAFMAFVALQILRDRQPSPSRKLWGKGGLFAAGGFIGSISAVVSIGGGSLTVPFLLWQNIDIRKAIGTSAALGMPLSIAGTAGFVLAGSSEAAPVAGSLGFVYLPAVVMISLASICTAPLGAAAAHALPGLAVKRVFALLQIALSVQMLISVM